MYLYMTVALTITMTLTMNMNEILMDRVMLVKEDLIRPAEENIILD